MPRKSRTVPNITQDEKLPRISEAAGILKIFDVPGSNSGVLYLYPHVGYCSFAVRGAFILLEMELMARKIDREL